MRTFDMSQKLASGIFRLARAKRAASLLCPSKIIGVNLFEVHFERCSVAIWKSSQDAGAEKRNGEQN